MAAKTGKRAKIRRLDASDDLYEIFGAGQGGVLEKPDCGRDEPFGTMLEEALSGIDHREMLRRKYPGPDAAGPAMQSVAQQAAPRAELDLHGCHVHEALVRVEAFVETCALQGLDAARIIVGRGLHSQSGAVLPDAVEKKIVELKRRGRIAAFAWEKRHKRASGSVIVYLP